MPAIVGPIHIDRVIGNGSAHFGDVLPFRQKVSITPPVDQVPIMQGTLSNFLAVQTLRLCGI